MNNLIKAAIALPISIGVMISANSTHAASFTYAETVESYTRGQFRYTDQNRITARTNENNALGAPDDNFLALGLAGEAVFSFGGMFSKQIKVWETTLGDVTSQSQLDEKVEVFVGNDLENWLSIGTIENIADQAYNGATLDIGNNNLYQYLRFVDLSEDAPDRDGFDINAVGVNIQPVPESSSMLGLLAVGTLAIGSLIKGKQ